MPRATSLAALLKDKLGIEVTLREGDRGEFSVWVGETCIADKDLKKCDEFPDTQRLLKKAERLLEP